MNQEYFIVDIKHCFFFFFFFFYEKFCSTCSHAQWCRLLHKSSHDKRSQCSWVFDCGLKLKWTVDSNNNDDLFALNDRLPCDMTFVGRYLVAYMDEEMNRLLLGMHGFDRN